MNHIKKQDSFIKACCEFYNNLVVHDIEFTNDLILKVLFMKYLDLK